MPIIADFRVVLDACVLSRNWRHNMLNAKKLYEE
jgi:hypothetical protein